MFLRIIVVVTILTKILIFGVSENAVAQIATPSAENIAQTISIFPNFLICKNCHFYDNVIKAKPCKTRVLNNNILLAVLSGSKFIYLM